MARQDLAAAAPPGGRDAGSAEDELVARTGKPLAHWTRVLDRFGAASKPTAAAVDHLQERHGVPRAWARTLLADYLKRAADGR